jgi:hypothetical protein
MADLIAIGYPDETTAALFPEQVDLLLDAARDPKPWLQAWTVLAAAITSTS